MTDEELSPLALLHRQLELERKGVDAAGRLYRLPGDNPDDIGRVLAAHLANGDYVAYFRDDLSDTTVAELRMLEPEQVHRDADQVMRILNGASAPESPVFRGRTFFFATITALEYRDVGQRDGRFVVLVDGAIAAEAWSSLSIEHAAELAVETRPEFRRRGYARQVCAAWASQQLAAGRVAFYSHSVDNTASAALARSLGVKHVMDIVSYE